MNPFDLRGPDFLVLYAELFVVVFLAAGILRWALRGPAGTPPMGIRSLNAYETALLSGGDRAAVKTALAGLVHRGLVKADTVKRLLVPSGQPEGKLPVQEQELFEQISATNGVGVDAATSQTETNSMTIMRERLETLGLLLTAAQAAWVRWVPLFLALSVPAFGVIKIFIGISRGRPVGILVVFCFVSVIGALALFGRRPLRTRSGDKALSSIWHDNSALRSAAREPDRLASSDVCLAVAIFGLGTVAVGGLADLDSALRPVVAHKSGWLGSCGGGCGGGGCGGGCGGGGCGGCSG
jgi:uncharacterized protein (TIGR04222 family)